MEAWLPGFSPKPRPPLPVVRAPVTELGEGQGSSLCPVKCERGKRHEKTAYSEKERRAERLRQGGSGRVC